MSPEVKIRNYLLGLVTEDDGLIEIEERILLDDEFAEELSAAEDELIEDFIDGHLSEEDRERFLEHFLITPERVKKMSLMSAVRKYAALQPEDPGLATVEAGRSKLPWFKHLLTLRFAFAAAVLLLAGIGVWRFAFYQSEAERGEELLRLAYLDSRPNESRISGFRYAPYSVTRGAGDAGNDDARRRGEILVTHAEADAATAETLAALGRFYLTEKKFFDAIPRFRQAAALDPKNARIEADWGAALLEAGRASMGSDDNIGPYRLLNESLEHLDKAVALDPKLLEARFNRALCLQKTNNPEQARNAWNEYLKLDPNSQWSAEARRYLDSIRTIDSKDVSDTELKNNFMQAFSEGNSALATQILASNRELISRKYIPQRLAMAFADGDDPEATLGAMRFAGEIELTGIGDPYAKELAEHYQNLPAADLPALKQAQDAVRRGYENCRWGHYPAALDDFSEAKRVFGSIGDEQEANLADYLSAYAKLNTEQAAAALTEFKAAVEYAHKRKYKWFEMTAQHWVAQTKSRMGEHAGAIASTTEALAMARGIRDTYAIQRNLDGLAYLFSFVGDDGRAVEFTEQGLKIGITDGNSLRQASRSYTVAVIILHAANLDNIAKASAAEAVFIADKIRLQDDRADLQLASAARSTAALAFFRSGDNDRARSLLDEAIVKSEAIDDPAVRRRASAFAYYHLGVVERQVGNLRRSLEAFDKAIDNYGAVNAEILQYLAEKGRLATLDAMGDDDALDIQIPRSLKFTEDFREKILDEQEKTSFFDNDADIYDVAVSHSFRQGRPADAFNFAEKASSRTLFDRIPKAVSGVNSGKRTDAEPLNLNAIVSRMPAAAQILQFSVTRDRVLIMLVSKETFLVVASDVKASGLEELVRQYVGSLRSDAHDSTGRSNEMSRRLYDILIAPVHERLTPGRQIVVVPDKSLYLLPFSALVGPDGKTLLSEFPLSYAPSSSVFVVASENATTRAGSSDESIVSVGDPAFDTEFYKSNPRLAAAADEAASVAKHYQRKMLITGEKATKTAILSTLGDAEILHYAGHYIAIPKNPRASFLLLAKNGDSVEDGVLTAREIEDQSLRRAKLVVLSACDTGIDTYVNGEGALGLSRTFLMIGAPMVVASQWNVDSDATAKLMDRFHYFRTSQAMSSANALRAAQLEFADDAAGQYRSPYYWAAFGVFGGYSTY